MFLKSIEIRGFKSFADKTELRFKKGITGVVGPNGSGKSNVSDAVRWVLGEQSVKSLRGGKMEDVIFAGTQFRKPVGLAQVALTLDNSDGELNIDYSDVTIARRLYRSGESEYYLNNTQCRLKDIQELFMDTGIGKEGYSIIGQGKIDAILSGKPEERRSLLEEAAGIVKFKTRKEEAERKLNNTEQNLVRINDILATYEERLEPLRIEHEKAKSFLKLSQELKEKEVNVIVDSIEGMEKRVNSVNASIAQAETDLNKILKDKEILKEKLEFWNNELELQEKKAQTVQEEYYSKKTEFQELQSETTLLKERIDNFSSLVSKTLKEIHEISNKTATISQGKALRQEELQAKQVVQNKLRDEIRDLEAEVSELSRVINKEENLTKRLKEDEIDFLSKLSDVKNNTLLLKNDEELLNKRLEQITTSCESYENSIKINVNTKVMLEKQILGIREKIQDFENDIRRKRAEITKKNTEVLAKEKELKDLTTDKHKSEASKAMLINLDKQYEGYNRAVKTLMQDISKGKVTSLNNAGDKCFVLGEIIKVEKKLETAIEIALGGGISDIITSDEVIAKTLINYLKSNNLGRATFLPLNIINGKSLTVAQNIQSLQGYIGIASELISYEGRFKNAVQYVLGKTIIAENMDVALKISKLSNYSYRIVTLGGEVVNPGGSLTGGSIYNKGANIIGRKRNIEEIDAKLVELEAKIKGLSEDISSRRQEIKSLDDDTLNLRDDIHYQNIEITKVQGKINAIDSDSVKLKANIEISQNEMQIIEESIEKNAMKLLKSEDEIEQLKLKEKENGENILSLEESLKSNLKTIEHKRNKLTEVKISKAQVDEIVLGMQKEIERLDLEISEQKAKLGKLKYENDRSEEQKQQWQQKIESNMMVAKGIEEYIVLMDESFKESEMQKIKIKDNLKLYSSEQEEINLNASKLEEDKHKAEINLARLQAERESLYTKLNDELELTYAEALEYKLENVDIISFKGDIVKLKTKISALGVVNVGAIEEYEEIREKYGFMNEQRQDLIMAKEELMGVIGDMTSNMKAVFSENFEKLRENFNETFKDLFKGGSADLILGQGDELTANIEINVQPPGKKLQNINLNVWWRKRSFSYSLTFCHLKDEAYAILYPR